jgi:hypothetical protein
MVAAWRHSEKCLAQTDRNSCVCGLTALQAFVAPMRNEVFRFGMEIEWPRVVATRCRVTMSVFGDNKMEPCGRVLVNGACPDHGWPREHQNVPTPSTPEDDEARREAAAFALYKRQYPRAMGGINGRFRDHPTLRKFYDMAATALAAAHKEP